LAFEQAPLNLLSSSFCDALGRVGLLHVVSLYLRSSSPRFLPFKQAKNHDIADSLSLAGLFSREGALEGLETVAGNNASDLVDILYRSEVKISTARSEMVHW